MDPRTALAIRRGRWAREARALDETAARVECRPGGGLIASVARLRARWLRVAVRAADARLRGGL